MHTFHLLSGKATISLQDIGVLTALPIDSVSIIGSISSQAGDEDIDKCGVTVMLQHLGVALTRSIHETVRDVPTYPSTSILVVEGSTLRGSCLRGRLEIGLLRLDLLHLSILNKLPKLRLKLIYQTLELSDRDSSIDGGM
ncbi:hypothetical protein VNO77_18759 [Canavalia gladiata]|uniref:Aminotransferase-like plant mobile domain-containing protein n=1 Tax=Canavalia gladiata TaxID=3824 RepID=A0AAN9LLE8_CANGL